MILTPEVRALLKRMDADDAIDKAVEMALEAAAKVCEEKFEARSASGHPREASAARSLASEIRALKDSK